MARRRESLGNVEASRSERYTGAGIVDSDVESERDTVPIFDNGGRICMLFGTSLFTTHQHVQTNLKDVKVNTSHTLHSLHSYARGPIVVMKDDVGDVGDRMALHPLVNCPLASLTAAFGRDS